MPDIRRINIENSNTWLSSLVCLARQDERLEFHGWWLHKGVLKESLKPWQLLSPLSLLALNYKGIYCQKNALPERESFKIQITIIRRVFNPIKSLFFGVAFRRVFKKLFKTE